MTGTVGGRIKFSSVGDCEEHKFYKKMFLELASTLRNSIHILNSHLRLFVPPYLFHATHFGLNGYHQVYC
jgi:hypothetical protein